MCACVQVVVLTDSPLAEQQRIADLCHASDIAVIVTDTRGLFGYASNFHLHNHFVCLKVVRNVQITVA